MSRPLSETSIAALYRAASPQTLGEAFDEAERRGAARLRAAVLDELSLTYLRVLAEVPEYVKSPELERLDRLRTTIKAL